MSKRVLKRELEAEIVKLNAEIRAHWFARKELGDPKAMMPCMGYDLSDRRDAQMANIFAYGFTPPNPDMAFSRFKEQSEL
jgi:hypothetical protein